MNPDPSPAQGLVATARNPVCMYRLVGLYPMLPIASALGAKSHQLPPRVARFVPDAFGCLSQHHSRTFPAMSRIPYPFAANDPTGAV